MSAALSAPHGLPVEIELAVRSRAIPQIQIDQALVSDAYFFRDRLEVSDGVLVQANGDLLLQLRSVGILAGLGEVIVLCGWGSPSRVGL